MLCGIVNFKSNSLLFPADIPCVLPPNTAYGVILVGVFCVTPFKLPEIAVPGVLELYVIVLKSTLTDVPQTGWSLFAHNPTVTVSPGFASCVFGASENVIAALTLGKIRASVNSSVVVFMG